MELKASSTGFRALEQIRYIMAADLGQSNDPTAIAVLEHVRSWREHWKLTQKFDVTEQFNVRHLARLPLGLSYPAVVQEVQRLLMRPPIAGQCELIIDETGVGRAVGDIFDGAGLNPTRVTITAGGEQSWHSPSWHVAKTILISTLDARLHTGDLRFAAELFEAEAMKEELKNFQRKVSVAGRYQYEARVGKHDDLVLAVAIGLWAAVGKPKPAYPTFGTYGRPKEEHRR